MGKTLVLSVVMCLLLVSCSGQQAIPTSRSSTPARPTPAATSTPTVSRSTELLPSPTLTPLPPYPNEKVIFEYYTLGNQSYFGPFFEQGFRELPKLVIYEDGLAIVKRDSYMQKVLSADQVKRLFSKLEELGFYSLESNQKHDPTDKLYNFANNYQGFADGLRECVYLKADQERTLCAHESQKQYLVPGMQGILRYLDAYDPGGLTPYYPDRILLWVQRQKDPYSDALPGTPIPWSDGLPNLDRLPPGEFSSYGEVPPQQISYFDGPTAKAIYLLLDGSPYADKVVTQDGQEYIVSTTVVLPHEQLTNAFH